MKISSEILNELKEVAPLLATLERVNVFRVPEGYFTKLNERLFSLAILNTPEELYFNRTNIQQVPEGYFDTLSTNILAKIKASYPETADEELNNLSLLLGSLKAKNVFKVPDGYFDSLSANVLAANKEINHETADQELHNLSSILYSLKKENVFEIPDRYFSNLSSDIIKKVKPASAKIVVMKSRNSWLRIAAAAVITGIIAIGSLQIFNNSSNQIGPDTLITASNIIPAYVKESFEFRTEKQLDAGIAKLSDDEIMKYLEKNGNVLDNDVLVNNTDASELPAQADYLNDENTLNSYLDQIDQEENSNLKN
ncbi:MAG: hypothetical protein ABJA90_05325 [Ginsengibacter sp.]